jgi:hypothetical protein
LLVADQEELLRDFQMVVLALVEQVVCLQVNLQELLAEELLQLP